MKDLILKWALKNAIEHDGKAVPGAVISKAIGENKELKNDMKTLGQEVSTIVQEVNKLDLGEQIAKLEDMAPELLEKKEEQRGLPELAQAVDGDVTMMFPPEPSKYATIGHARACYLNYYYTQKHNGNFTIRFEDTNAGKVKQEYVEQMLNDFKWLGITWNNIDYISNHIEKMYDFAQQLIDTNKAYMCNCPIEKLRNFRAKKETCLCRDNPPEENSALWKDMLNGDMKKGDYSLRSKIDMQHKNAALRDPTIMRLNPGTHFRTKDNFIVWPTYDFATSIMDGIENITHRLRGKEFEQKAELQQWFQEQLGIKPPVIIEFARTNMTGVAASGRIIREGIANGEFIGWDDPRLPTLLALRKRGFQPEAIKNFIVDLGITKSESTIEYGLLEAENRKLIEPIANRYMMVRDKIKMIIKKSPKDFKTKLKIHPNNSEQFKEYEFPGDEIHVFVEKKDMLNRDSGDHLRLMDLCNIKLEIITPDEIIAQFDGKDMESGIKIIHWIPTTNNHEIEIMMADGELYYGLAESAINTLNEDDIIQFIRFGFCRLNEKGKPLKFRFTHT